MNPLHPSPITPTTPPRLALSPEEAAAALGLSERTLQDLRKRGEVPTVRIGRRVLHPVDALRRWLDDLAADDGGQP